ncbi:DeoR/GlpR family DNA-binding transcription regulator [Pseudoneobacillus sp. C159]
MLTPERHRLILELLDSKQVVKLQELVEVTNSSESTIRRDLAELEKDKKLKRVHGGASLLKQIGEELSISEKSTKNLQEKEEIARYAASLIKDGDCIYLDAGTTVVQMIPYLEAKEIRIVTNGLTHIEALLERNIPTYLIGGYIKPKTRAIVGPSAIDALKQYRFDKSFIGVNGVHLDQGFTTPDPEEAAVKNLAMQLGQEVFILADYTKFNEVTFAKVAELKEATIITNQMDNEWLTKYKKKTTIKVVTS